MDTMVLMAICRGNDEIMGTVDAVLKDRVLLIIRDVMDEAIGVYGRVDRRGAKVPDSFTSSVRFNFIYRDTEFELVHHDPDICHSALSTFAERKYLNKNGVPLSCGIRKVVPPSLGMILLSCLPVYYGFASRRHLAHERLGRSLLPVPAE